MKLSYRVYAELTAVEIEIKINEVVTNFEKKGYELINISHAIYMALDTFTFMFKEPTKPQEKKDDTRTSRKSRNRSTTKSQRDDGGVQEG